jgi:hypothetical protein
MSFLGPIGGPWNNTNDPNSGATGALGSITGMLGLGSPTSPQRSAPLPGGPIVPPSPVYDFGTGRAGASLSPSDAQQQPYAIPGTMASPIFGSVASQLANPLFSSGVNPNDPKNRRGGMSVGV